MRVDDLVVLKNKTDVWRSSKSHLHEAVPKDLIKMALDGVSQHGMRKIVAATGFRPGMIKKWSVAPSRKNPLQTALPASTPTYTKISVMPPQFSSPVPLAEIEMPSGCCVRLYTITPELSALVLSLSPTGGN
jgi:hypothetical protein